MDFSHSKLSRRCTVAEVYHMKKPKILRLYIATSPAEDDNDKLIELNFTKRKNKASDRQPSKFTATTSTDLDVQTPNDDSGKVKTSGACVARVAANSALSSIQQTISVMQQPSPITLSDILVEVGITPETSNVPTGIPDIIDVESDDLPDLEPQASPQSGNCQTNVLCPLKWIVFSSVKK